MRWWAAVWTMMLVAGCARLTPTPPFGGESYLLVWAGDADRQNADFLAVLDADPGSPSYGKVLRTYPVRSRGNEPQALNVEPRPDRRVFATGVLTNRTFAFDMRQPLAGRLLHVDEAGPGRRLWAPYAVATLPNGHVVVTAADPAGYRGDPRDLLTKPGGLIELTAGGELVREISAADSAARGLIIAPHGVAASAALDRLVTTNEAHGYAATTHGDWMPGISAQVWRLGDLKLLKTAVLEAGPRGEENLGPAEVHFLRQKPVVCVATSLGSALYVSDSLTAPEPVFRLVFDFGAGAFGGGAAVTPDDRFYVQTLTGSNRLVSLDLADPWRPTLVSALRFDRAPEDPSHTLVGRPHGLAMSADGSRVAVADYTIDVPAYHIDGDRRVYMVRLDRTTGQLRFDDAFRDEVTGGIGVDFGRSQWPHGDTGPAHPLGMLFVTAEPPSAR